jgi:long-chain acyl-CoA synthetase
MENNIISMIENRAIRFGDREVLRYKDSTTMRYNGISWEEFWGNSQKVARAILASGYGQGTNIGIMCDNMPEWTMTDIGILASRNIVVPIFGNASQDQIKFIVDHTQMQLMFVGNQSQLNNAYWALKNCTTLEKIVVIKKELDLPSTSCQYWSDFLAIDKEGKFIAELKKVTQEINSEDLATILYTSGTTGDPKGVMLTHSNFTSCFDIHDKRLNLSEKDISLFFYLLAMSLKELGPIINYIKGQQMFTLRTLGQ